MPQKQYSQKENSARGSRSFADSLDSALVCTTVWSLIVLLSVGTLVIAAIACMALLSPVLCMSLATFAGCTLGFLATMEMKA